MTTENNVNYLQALRSFEDSIKAYNLQVEALRKAESLLIVQKRSIQEKRAVLNMLRIEQIQRYLDEKQLEVCDRRDHRGTPVEVLGIFPVSEFAMLYRPFKNAIELLCHQHLLPPYNLNFETPRNPTPDQIPHILMERKGKFIQADDQKIIKTLGPDKYWEDRRKNRYKRWFPEEFYQYFELPILPQNPW
jgi:hypothetical protein